jgi:hypothetical protein
MRIPITLQAVDTAHCNLVVRIMDNRNHPVPALMTLEIARISNREDTVRDLGQTIFITGSMRQGSSSSDASRSVESIRASAPQSDGRSAGPMYP